MSERYTIVIDYEARRIQWVCESGYLHVIWPSDLKDYEIEGIEALFGLALRQMKRQVKARPTDEGNTPAKAEETAQ